MTPNPLGLRAVLRVLIFTKFWGISLAGQAPLMLEETFSKREEMRSLRWRIVLDTVPHDFLGNKGAWAQGINSIPYICKLMGNTNFFLIGKRHDYMFL